jgi:hypothetical protein
VIVIAAHCALPLWPWRKPSDFIDLQALFDLAKTHNWKLSADLSALFFGTREKYFAAVKDLGENNLIYGSDFPITILDIPDGKPANFLLAVAKFMFSYLFENPLNKSVKLMKRHFPGVDFYNANKVLRLPPGF